VGEPSRRLLLAESSTYQGKGVQVNSPRKSALVTGVFFIITFIAAIGGLVLYGPVLNDPHYILGAGTDTRVSLGAFFEIILVIANIGTAVTLFPILKRQNEGVALGYVSARVLESTIIVVGIVSLLSVVTLRHDLAGATGADAASLVTAGKSLVAFHDRTFLLGPGFVAGAGNGLLLGYLMYRSALVPRAMAVLGLVGGPLVVASGTAVLFGLYQQVSVWSFIATLPEIAWEATLGIWLIAKGFKPSPITTDDTRHVGVDECSRAPAAAAG
jgi:hypothetical protein